MIKTMLTPKTDLAINRIQYTNDLKNRFNLMMLVKHVTKNNFWGVREFFDGSKPFIIMTI